ncbi:MFS transporter [Micromonospora sp. CB01531]|uniref:MFS transporter n=1 Tax=Micromonospora sp. CB01531 TaxID=1718947 RepID=UPI000939C9AB|nr:MFS transporter [Micromonospora sp. CB01531]OKI62359.1 MFS transporter [Micromonospora sp. CB01531]
MHVNDNTPAPLAGRREWLGLAVLALPTLLLSVDISVLFLALPRLDADLAATSTQQLWIIDVYGFMTAGFLVTMGSLGDRIGRRRLLLIGAACFGLVSVLAAYSTSAEMLIGARALLGIAGATVMPSALALISNMFPNPKQQGMAIAVFMSCFMAGGAIGPVVGGAMLTSFWWGSVFLLAVPVMLLLLVAGPALLPEYRNPEGGRLDLVSVVLSLAAILSLIYGIKELARAGWELVPVLSLVIGLVFAAVFVRRQRTQREPLLDLRLFRHRSFSAALAIMLFGTAMMSGLSLFFTLFLQLVKGLSPLSTGLLMVISAVGMVIGAMVAPGVAQKVRPGTVLAAGLGIAAIGFLVVSRVEESASLALPIIGIAIVSLGAGAFASLGTGLVVGSVPPEKVGSASAVSETGGEFGVAFGIAVIGSVGTAIYRNLLELPAEVPAGAATSARENITGAAAAAAELPEVVGTALFDAARAAFTTALHGVAVVSATIAVGLAVVAVLALRQAPPTGAVPAPDGAEDTTPAPAAEPMPASGTGN